MPPTPFMLDMPIKALEQGIDYKEGILLMGSCFTEEIGSRLQTHKFRVLQNPNGILYDPLSISRALISYIQVKEYTEKDIFFLNDRWQSWDHHSRLAALDQQDCLTQMNSHLRQAHEFLQQARWLILTPGTSISYRLAGNGRPVANCHKAPARLFRKQLLSVEETVASFDQAIHQLFHFNPSLNIIFTVSPVRHLRDGLIENARSKARLVEAVQHLCGKFSRLTYFPAYELQLDVLRDYRFFEADLVHPNRQAADYIFERFAHACLEEKSRQMIRDLQPLLAARSHRPFFPASASHQKFLQQQLRLSAELEERYPGINLEEEKKYFRGTADAQAT